MIIVYVSIKLIILISFIFVSLIYLIKFIINSVKNIEGFIKKYLNLSLIKGKYYHILRKNYTYIYEISCFANEVFKLVCYIIISYVKYLNIFIIATIDYIVIRYFLVLYNWGIQIKFKYEDLYGLAKKLTLFDKEKVYNYEYQCEEEKERKEKEDEKNYREEWRMDKDEYEMKKKEERRDERKEKYYQTEFKILSTYETARFYVIDKLEDEELSKFIKEGEMEEYYYEDALMEERKLYLFGLEFVLTKEEDNDRYMRIKHKEELDMHKVGRFLDGYLLDKSRNKFNINFIYIILKLKLNKLLKRKFYWKIWNFRDRKILRSKYKVFKIYISLLLEDFLYNKFYLRLLKKYNKKNIFIRIIVKILRRLRR
jgi:hypothetical protein